MSLKTSKIISKGERKIFHSYIKNQNNLNFIVKSLRYNDFEHFCFGLSRIMNPA